MPQTIVAIDPKTRRRALLIEIHPDSDKPSHSDIHAFQKRMHERNIYAGMIITPKVVLIELDQLNDVGFQRLNYDERTLATDELFNYAKIGAPQVGTQFYPQVKKWLKNIESSWFSILNREAIEAMVPEVVGSLLEAELATWDNVLETEDAA